MASFNCVSDWGSLSSSEAGVTARHNAEPSEPAARVLVTLILALALHKNGFSPPARPFDTVGELLELLRYSQEQIADLDVAHSLGLSPNGLRPLPVLPGAGLKRIGIVSHTPNRGKAKLQRNPTRALHARLSPARLGRGDFYVRPVVVALETRKDHLL